MHAQICTLHDISAASDVASAHSLMALRALAAQNYCVLSGFLFFDQTRSRAAGIDPVGQLPAGRFAGTRSDWRPANGHRHDAAVRQGDARLSGEVAASPGTPAQK